VIYQVLADPGGICLPGWLNVEQNYGIKTMPAQKNGNEDKFKNVKVVVTTTPHIKK